MRRWLGSVRVRATLAAVLVMGFTLLVSSVALSALVRRSLARNLQRSAELRAADVASLVREGRLPRTIPEPADEDLALVQVVDERGVIAASPKLLEDGATIPAFLPPAESFMVRILRGPEFDDDDDFVTVARRVMSPAAPSGIATVYVAASLSGVNRTVATVDRLLVIGGPLVVLGVGITSWLVMGRALRPVESIRSEVAEITEHDLTRRVPEPEADDEVGRLARTMNAMLGRLQASADRQRRFVADASHELQSPLASVRAQLEVGLSDAEATDWPTTATEVLNEQARMERLVGDLLLMARTDENRSPTRNDLVDLDDLTLDEANRVRARGRVRVNLARLSGGQVVGDADQLRRVIRNVLENAERHARTTVDVELRTRDGSVELSISDDGDGIAAGDRDRVFERFTRIDNGRSRAVGGTGLGLAIAKDVIQSHGGTIAVIDRSYGACIGIRLPSADRTGRS
jgi:signal transduction histidine kinase